jgi:RNA ligase (TIGR02306 family)
MSTFSCPIVQVSSVEHHPDADRLSLVRMHGLGYLAISAKTDDGSHRYKPGDHVVYIPSQSVLPEWLLKEMGFWNHEANKGTLAGSNGDRVKPMRLRGIFSEGVIFPTVPMHLIPNACMLDIAMEHDGNDGLPMLYLGDDASGVLGITKWDPPIPTHMAGDVANLGDVTVRYDFERLESVPDLFEPGEIVVAREKLHGTFAAILFVPGLDHPQMFGSRGEIVVHSKGLGSKGLAFTNSDNNKHNLYVRQLQAMLSTGFEDRLRRLSAKHSNAGVWVLGEIFGHRVQDLDYGQPSPQFRAFDIAVNGEWTAPLSLDSVAGELALTTVPTLRVGPFDLPELEKIRDGKSTLGGNHTREGVVVTAVSPRRDPRVGRRIAKLISPAYLTRKNGTEFN